MPAKKQVTKEMILTTALKLLREQGYEAVNIKQLAQALGCSTQPVYLSFSGMEQLRGELAPLAAAEFETYMKDSGKGDTVRVYDMRYIRFAKEEPHLFRFLFMRSNAFAEIKQALLPMIEGAIGELMDTYHIDHEKADLLHDQLWMHAHGIASMIATNFCDWDMGKVERLLTDCRCAFAREFCAVKRVYHAAAFIKAVPACAERSGMSDGRIICKQSVCIGQLAVFVPHIEGIEQLFFHAVARPSLIPFAQLGKSVILEIILGNQFVICCSVPSRKHPVYSERMLKNGRHGRWLYSGRMNREQFRRISPRKKSIGRDNVRRRLHRSSRRPSYSISCSRSANRFEANNSGIVIPKPSHSFWRGEAVSLLSFCRCNARRVSVLLYILVLTEDESTSSLEAKNRYLVLYEDSYYYNFRIK